MTVEGDRGEAVQNAFLITRSTLRFESCSITCGHSLEWANKRRKVRCESDVEDSFIHSLFRPFDIPLILSVYVVYSYDLIWR